MERQRRHLVKDLIIILFSALVAWVIVREGLIVEIVHALDGFGVISSLVAGFFFTSAFTTLPAVVILGQLALVQPIWLVALLGGLGAMVGDLILVRFIRSDLLVDLKYLSHITHMEKVRHLFRVGFLHWLMPLLGAIIIVSPLPDEVGLILLGVSKAPLRRLALIIFCVNVIGVLIIALIARGI